MSQLKQCLRSAPCLAYPDPGKEFYLDAGFSDQCLSAGLYQLHDKDKRVVAYASKTLLPPECKYSHCEKALLCTVWGIQRFSNYIGAQKVIIETCHQPVTFLNSQRIRDGVVTNARIATWLMTLQGRDVEARYAQNYKSSLGNGLAACQNCSTDTLDTSAEPKELPRPQATNHRYFEENVCTGMPTAYVDGCSYNREGKLQAGAGVVWLNNDPCPPQQLKLGPQSSQYAEIAAILITLQVAATHKIRELLICTDSNYARLSFICHLTGWKRNGFKTANNKPVKHQELFQASDAIVTEHDMVVYWKKVRGHSRQPGQDKDLNDQTDALAKAGAVTGRVLDISCPPTPPNCGSGDPPPKCREWAHTCLLPHLPVASVRCWRPPHPPTYGLSHTVHCSTPVRPLGKSHFHLGPTNIIRPPHAPFDQAHAASTRRCPHVCPWAIHCSKARSPSWPKGDDVDTRTRCTMRRTPRSQGHLWNTQASSILAWHAARRSRIR